MKLKSYFFGNFLDELDIKYSYKLDYVSRFKYRLERNL